MLARGCNACSAGEPDLADVLVVFVAVKFAVESFRLLLKLLLLLWKALPNNG